ncbi:hypothetical protein O181_126214 [Austropuccinia psidii MF-1]|uniref:Uncharacterized protein n=1 Tax=Austropuccinia psidii MF-1 TaxID=1389203 RepID=A0A9Q3KSW8_9BASI|nr:hypothetical protein [Austropuccinia psidii MF-1]
MQWLSSTYNGNLQEYTDKSHMLMMSLETINIHVPSKFHTFTILTKLSGDPNITQFIEVLSLNKDLVEEPELILCKLQDFHKNSQSQGKSSIPLATTALVSESAGPYNITYYCSNGKHNPNCTSHTKEECFAKHPELRPPYCRNNKRKNTFNQNASTHISTAQALVTCRETHSVKWISLLTVVQCIICLTPYLASLLLNKHYLSRFALETPLAPYCLKVLELSL